MSKGYIALDVLLFTLCAFLTTLSTFRGELFFATAFLMLTASLWTVTVIDFIIISITKGDD